MYTRVAGFDSMRAGPAGTGPGFLEVAEVEVADAVVEHAVLDPALGGKGGAVAEGGIRERAPIEGFHGGVAAHLVTVATAQASVVPPEIAPTRQTSPLGRLAPARFDVSVLA